MIRPVLRRWGCCLLACLPGWLWAQGPPNQAWLDDAQQYAVAYVRFNTLLLQQLEPVSRQLGDEHLVSPNLAQWQRLNLPAKWRRLQKQARTLRSAAPSEMIPSIDALQLHGTAALRSIEPLWVSADTAGWRQGLEQVASHQRSMREHFVPLRKYLMHANQPSDVAGLGLLEDFLQTSESILEAIQGDNPEGIRRAYHSLRALQTEIVRQKESWIASWPTFPESSRDPAPYLHTWLSQADKWLNYLDGYLSGIPLHPPFATYPVGYAYRQFRLWPLYNGQGQGLLDSYLKLHERITEKVIWWPPLLGYFEARPVFTPAVSHQMACHYVLILDVSASMANSHKWKQVIAQVDRWTRVLGPDDRLSLVSCGPSVEIWERGQTRDTIQQNLERWKTYALDGGSNISEALEAAFQLAGDSWLGIPSSRVLFITDGGFDIPFSALATLQITSP
ncbi:MAG: vWA domain-containing protein, partial [Bacteroidota bacterium]